MSGFTVYLPTWLQWTAKRPPPSTTPPPETPTKSASPYMPTFVGAASDVNKAIKELDRHVDAAKDSEVAIDVSEIEKARVKTVQLMSCLVWMAQEEENHNFASQCLVGDLNSSFMIALKACDEELSRQKGLGSA